MQYIILSLTKSNPGEPVFWRANNCGFTYFPFNAGLYAECTINADQAYYNNGHDTLAIPLTEEGLKSIGFITSFDIDLVKQLAVKCLHQVDNRNEETMNEDNDDDFSFDFPEY